jgi:hypothetical protein
MKEVAAKWSEEGRQVTSMSTRTWHSELARFHQLSQLEQLAWLSQLVHLISMFARGTYEAGADGVLQPKDLRRFNELIHRIATFMKKVARGGSEGMPDSDLFEMIERELSELGIQNEEVLKRLP